MLCEQVATESEIKMFSNCFDFSKCFFFLFCIYNKGKFMQHAMETGLDCSWRWARCQRICCN